MTPYFSEEELRNFGFRSLGKDVRLSRRTAVYGADKISIGNHVRIDDFCVLSAGEGGISFGDYIHLAIYCSIMGAGAVILEDFVGFSSRVSVYSSNDDYSGIAMTNPTVPVRFTAVQRADVRICKHSIVGSGSVILPGVTIGDGAAVGALSLVVRDCAPFGIYAGTPARRISERMKNFLDLEKQLRQDLSRSNS